MIIKRSKTHQIAFITLKNGFQIVTLVIICQNLKTALHIYRKPKEHCKMAVTLQLSSFKIKKKNPLQSHMRIVCRNERSRFNGMAMLQTYKHTFAEQILYLKCFSRWLKLVTHLSKASEDEILVVEVVVAVRKSGIPIGSDWYTGCCWRPLI